MLSPDFTCWPLKDSSLRWRVLKCDWSAVDQNTYRTWSCPHLSCSGPLGFLIVCPASHVCWWYHAAVWHPKPVSDRQWVMRNFKIDFARNMSFFINRFLLTCSGWQRQIQVEGIHCTYQKHLPKGKLSLMIICLGLQFDFYFFFAIENGNLQFRTKYTFLVLHLFNIYIFIFYDIKDMNCRFSRSLAVVKVLYFISLCWQKTYFGLLLAFSNRPIMDWIYFCF